MNYYLQNAEENAYTTPCYLKSKLIEHFGESILISEKHGQNDIVIVRESVSSIIRTHYLYQQSKDIETEKIRLIETAAKLIKSDIKDKVIGLRNKEFYPVAADLEIQECLEYLPSRLVLLCSKIFFVCNALKIAADGQCIIQSCTPRTVIASLQLGLSLDKNIRGNLKFQLIPSREVTHVGIDLLWKTAWHLRLCTPGWSGTMECIHPSNCGKSTVVILLIINLQLSDITCILSTMKYVCHLSKTQDIYPICTFDQPLLWKASIIANDINYKTENDDLVIILGSFHTLMNFLGAIGDLMAGSGLEDVLQTLYGSNTVNHILTGKAVSRAFHGHMLVDSALSSIILSDILSEEKNKHLANNLRKTSVTSEVWLQYQSMVELSCKLVQADCPGCWLSNLNAIHECLPGCHVVHRSDRPWSGLGCDLVIEQVLMRSIKTNGGLTRGSGLSESVRAQWVLSMPACCEYSVAMQTLTQTAYTTSEQHKEMHKSRLTQNREDGAKVLAFLQQNSPFTTDTTLRNIVTGHTFDTHYVNVQNMSFIGENILKNLVGKDVFTFSCNRKDSVQTLASSAKVKVNSDDGTSFDKGLLFQRLSVATNNGGASLEEVLDHELCPYPPSPFETLNML
ncbi:hypothetical protein PR048_010217 [Dryococelus australis]|uniref:Uncharacterized protein n=1 Tax=Dryococelus australis TaxID=614101 RepID=A0ABQ9I449_9NEOP|nr:hypothetical protein PR048_010217 [Dryococelus australis]